MTYDTREAWLVAAANAILADIIGVDGTKFVVSCGWPSRRGTAANRRIGECWAPTACSDGITHNLFISPTLANVAEVMETLAHELVHAVVGVEAKHTTLFKRLAKRIGLEGRMTATHAGDNLRLRLLTIAGALGTYPHGALNVAASGQTKQSTRLRRICCSNCGWTMRVTQKWIDVGLPPACQCGGEFCA